MIDELLLLKSRREELDKEIADFKYNMLNKTVGDFDYAVHINSFSGLDKLHVAKIGVEDYFNDKIVEVILTKDMIVDIVNTLNNYLEIDDV